MALVKGAFKRDAFVQRLRKAGVPRLEINKRVFLYRREDIMNFESQKNDR